MFTLPVTKLCWHWVRLCSFLCVKPEAKISNTSRHCISFLDSNGGCFICSDCVCLCVCFYVSAVPSVDKCHCKITSLESCYLCIYLFIDYVFNECCRFGGIHRSTSPVRPRSPSRTLCRCPSRSAISAWRGPVCSGPRSSDKSTDTAVHWWIRNYKMHTQKLKTPFRITVNLETNTA
jgi:hypothetical protein